MALGMRGGGKRQGLQPGVRADVIGRGRQWVTGSAARSFLGASAAHLLISLRGSSRQRCGSGAARQAGEGSIAGGAGRALRHTCTQYSVRCKSAVAQARTV